MSFILHLDSKPRNKISLVNFFGTQLILLIQITENKNISLLFLCISYRRTGKKLSNYQEKLSWGIIPFILMSTSLVDYNCKCCCYIQRTILMLIIYGANKIYKDLTNLRLNSLSPGRAVKQSSLLDRDSIPCSFAVTWRISSWCTLNEVYFCSSGPK